MHYDYFPLKFLFCSIDYHIDKFQQRRLVFQRGEGKNHFVKNFGPIVMFSVHYRRSVYKDVRQKN